MPLDFCHPNTPHRKLRMPEWFVSSLMMDRALDAVVRRAMRLDRKHDIPYLAGTVRGHYCAADPWRTTPSICTNLSYRKPQGLSQGVATMASTGIDIDTLLRDGARDNTGFLDQLRSIVGRRHVLTNPESTRRYRTGFRFGYGPALAVVRPGSLVEQWRVLKTCAQANKIIIMQAANTGLTGGSTPHGSDYDREIVIVSTQRLARIRLINEGRQVICHPGATLFQLEN